MRSASGKERPQTFNPAALIARHPEMLSRLKPRLFGSLYFSSSFLASKASFAAQAFCTLRLAVWPLIPGCSVSACSPNSNAGLHSAAVLRKLQVWERHADVSHPNESSSFYNGVLQRGKTQVSIACLGFSSPHARMAAMLLEIHLRLRQCCLCLLLWNH